jgi:CBS domain-containing protein
MNTIRDILEVKGKAVHTTHISATIDEAAIDMCRDPASTTVGEMMTRRVFCIDKGSTLSEAMGAMTDGHYRHLPVLAEGKIVGLVSIGDLVRASSGDQERELRALHEYVEGRYPG